ncbi:hypothetical protein CALCODRAFT_506267 [Calocera cornea HHB12733]|uniref:Uncharacterized protein n=1 Tax=Calocera cornea HHB12733 TaxID=1353952 RepID=A0A165J1E3_9BASI|nr:hypothetical protein CALCODRAFT_506267 [Calocera cornea HHB12733]
MSLPALEPTTTAWLAWASLSVSMSKKWDWKEPAVPALYVDCQETWTAEMMNTQARWQWDPRRSGEWAFVHPKLERLKGRIQKAMISQMLMQDYLCSHPATLAEHDGALRRLVSATEVQYIHTIFKKGVISYCRVNGTPSSFQLLVAKTVFDMSSNMSITNFEIKDTGMASSCLVMKAALLEMFAMQMEDNDTDSSSD